MTTFEKKINGQRVDESFQSGPGLKCWHWVSFLVILVTCGCSSVKDHHIDTDRSRYYPLAVYSATSVPELSGRIDAEGTGSTLKCLTGAVVFTFGLLAPLCAPVVVFDAMAVADNQAEMSSLEKSIAPLLPRLEKLAEQDVLRGHTMAYLMEQNVEADNVGDLAPTDDAENRARIFREQGFPMALEVSLLQLEYQKFEDSICATVRIQGRTLETAHNRQVGFETLRKSSCKTANEWSEGDRLEAEIMGIYAALSKQLVDEILFKYQPIDHNAIKFTALAPSPDLEIYEEFVKKVENCKPHLERCNHNLTAWIDSGNPLKPKQLKDLITVSIWESGKVILEFKEVPLTPDFEWSALEGPGVTDVSYYLTIFEGKEHVAVRCQKFGGNYHPCAKFIVTSRKIYDSEGLGDTLMHQPIKLEPCRWFFWKVGARYQLFGNKRYTDMTTRIPGSNRRITLHPFRTRASEENPDCWNQAVDWGPLGEASQPE